MIDKRPVFLCGFSGAGKSTLAKKQEMSSFECVDLDEWILNFYGLCPRRHGLRAFRYRELMAIEHLCALKKTEKRLVVALGGGALSEKSLSMIQERGGCLVWLDTPFEECFGRITSSEDRHRPLAQKGKEYLKKLYCERLPLYQKADLRFKIPAL